MLWRGLLLVQAMTLFAGPRIAGTMDPALGCADSFAVLSAAGVSNQGRSFLFGDLGVNPGAAVTGFPPGAVFDGSIYLGGPVVQEGRQDAFAAYSRLMRLPSLAIPSSVEGSLGGLRLSPGVYAVDASARLKGTLLLDAQDEDHAAFIFQVSTTLTTARDAKVVLVNRGRGDAVYWVVGGPAKLGANTSFEGNILAQKDIAMGSGARIRCGRAFSLTGAVALDRNYIFSACESGGMEGSIATGTNQQGAFPPPPGRGNVGSLPEPGTFWLAAVSLATLAAAKFHRSRHLR